MLYDIGNKQDWPKKVPPRMEEILSTFENRQYLISPMKGIVPYLVSTGIGLNVHLRWRHWHQLAPSRIISFPVIVRCQEYSATIVHEAYNSHIASTGHSCLWQRNRVVSCRMQYIKVPNSIDSWKWSVMRKISIKWFVSCDCIKYSA